MEEEWKLKSAKILAGSTDVINRTDPKMRVRVKNFTLHDNVDLAIVEVNSFLRKIFCIKIAIQLNTSIDFNATVQPICLANMKNFTTNRLVGYNATIVGWGSISGKSTNCKGHIRDNNKKNMNHFT